MPKANNKTAFFTNANTQHPNTICFKGTGTKCILVYETADEPTANQEITQNDLTLDQCRELSTTLPPSSGTGQWTDIPTGQQELWQWNTIPTAGGQAYWWQDDNGKLVLHVDYVDPTKGISTSYDTDSLEYNITGNNPRWSLTAQLPPSAKSNVQIAIWGQATWPKPNYTKVWISQPLIIPSTATDPSHQPFGPIFVIPGTPPTVPLTIWEP